MAKKKKSNGDGRSNEKGPRWHKKGPWRIMELSRHVQLRKRRLLLEISVDIRKANKDHVAEDRDHDRDHD